MGKSSLRMRSLKEGIVGGRQPPVSTPALSLTVAMISSNIRLIHFASKAQGRHSHRVVFPREGGEDLPASVLWRWTKCVKPVFSPPVKGGKSLMHLFNKMKTQDHFAGEE